MSVGRGTCRSEADVQQSSRQDDTHNALSQENGETSWCLSSTCRAYALVRQRVAHAAGRIHDVTLPRIK